MFGWFRWTHQFRRGTILFKTENVLLCVAAVSDLWTEWTYKLNDEVLNERWDWWPRRQSSSKKTWSCCKSLHWYGSLFNMRHINNKNSVICKRCILFSVTDWCGEGWLSVQDRTGSETKPLLQSCIITCVFPANRHRLHQWGWETEGGADVGVSHRRVQTGRSQHSCKYDCRHQLLLLLLSYYQSWFQCWVSLSSASVYYILNVF